MGGSTIGSKEKETLGGLSEFPGSIGQEGEIPKEAASVGVSMRPTTVPIPQPVAQWVTPLGQNVPIASSTGTITLPITDAEIVQGLSQSPTTSWRFLAEWCKRRLKQLRLWRK